MIQRIYVFFVRPPPRPPPHFERLALDIVHMNYWCAKMVSAYHADSVYFYAPDEVCVQCQAATNNSNANMKADGGRWLWDCGSDRFFVWSYTSSVQTWRIIIGTLTLGWTCIMIYWLQWKDKWSVYQCIQQKHLLSCTIHRALVPI